MESVETTPRSLQDVADVTTDPRTEWPAALISSSITFEKESVQWQDWDKPNLHEELELTTVRQEEKVEVAEFLLAHFFPEVPIGKVVDMDVDLEVRPWVFDFIHLVLAAPSTSIQLRHRTSGRIVAVAINAIGNDDGQEHPPSPDLADFVHPDRHPKMYMNLKFLEELSAVPDDWKFANNKMFNIFMLAVDPHYGQRGLASKLVRLSIQLAASLGIKTVVSQAVNYYAIKTLKKCGFRSLKQLPYGRFVYHGDTPLANNGVHQGAEFLFLEI